VKSTLSIYASERELLLILLAEVEILGEVVTTRRTAGDNSSAVSGRGVRYEPSRWFGQRMSQTRRKSFSRAARRLSDRGLVIRATEPKRDRVTHLAFTANGLKQAMTLAGRDADRSAVIAGLRRTAWGRALLDSN
jgi:hypothetical protein